MSVISESGLNFEEDAELNPEKFINSKNAYKNGQPGCFRTPVASPPSTIRRCLSKPCDGIGQSPREDFFIVEVAFIAQCKCSSLRAQLLESCSFVNNFYLSSPLCFHDQKRRASAAKLPLSLKSITVGLLALQGDFAAHLKIFHELGAQTHMVRTPQDLGKIDAIAIPGGESTVMSRLSERYGLFDPLRDRISEGLPAFGTCAGLIFLSKHIVGASQTFQQTTLGVLDCTVARNAYGAQKESFQTTLEVKAIDASIQATFIRAPKITAIGENVEVLATLGDAPVVVRQKGIVACSFHPEIEGESRIHRLWLEGIARQGP